LSLGRKRTRSLPSLDAIVADVVGTGRAASVDRKVVNDLPARALLDASEGADQLAVGARGLDGFRGLLLGSVSQQCLHLATCPVAVVREGVHHWDELRAQGQRLMKPTTVRQAPR
jgi:nucleotide-binding universal stress UspA family protein